MNPLTSQLVLAPDDAIDLQMHTTYSDGRWTPEQLVDYLVSEQFGLVAVTDHDRIDASLAIQQLAAQKGLPVLAAVEMTTRWRSYPTDILCYGFSSQHDELKALGDALLQAQQENVREVYEHLVQEGYQFPRQQTLLAATGGMPLRVSDIANLLIGHRYAPNSTTLWKILSDAGLREFINDIDPVIEAAHRAGALCILAHPGREDITRYSETMLDQLCQEVALDGLEVYYPLHSAEQTCMYLAYAQNHHLLTSAGSDSHSPDRPPIKYRADLCRQLLARVGILVQ
ncbi:PHP domain-containing protein [Dictyobacter kobayashii]|uniref:Phosphatase n=1 Tax=Dictyobacter kobayashii TaxID=2014872 RepID=A0A402AUJ9_9CHLR|nr:PHP domain-containing protein [Dictyobacter kobayashii]GCE22764.1 phosphatase [Dictyobacter kobayashii]